VQETPELIDRKGSVIHAESGIERNATRISQAKPSSSWKHREEKLAFKRKIPLHPFCFFDGLFCRYQCEDVQSSRGDKVSKTIDGSFATLRKSVALPAVLLLFSVAAICQGPATKVPPQTPARG